MGKVINMIKNNASSALNQVKSSVDMNAVTGTLNNVKSSMNIPDIQIPDNVKNMASNINQFKVPDANGYIQPVKNKLSGLLSGVNLPSEVGGIKLPELPDMSSLTNMANSYLADTGIALKQGISFGDIKQAVTKSDFSNIIDFKLPDMPIDMNSIDHVADGTITSLDSFDLSQTQSEIDAMTSQYNMESIDISQFF